jgi:hypothetical protein
MPVGPRAADTIFQAVPFHFQIREFDVNSWFSVGELGKLIAIALFYLNLVF